MNGMRKLLFILMVLPFTLNVRAEDPPSMLEKAVSNIKRWEGWHRGENALHRFWTPPAPP